MTDAERQQRLAAFYKYFEKFEDPEMRALREKMEKEAKDAAEETRKFLAEVRKERTGASLAAR